MLKHVKCVVFFGNLSTIMTSWVIAIINSIVVPYKEFSLFQNESPRKKARRSLERKWSTPGDINLFGGISGESLGINPETPVRI